MITNTEIEVWKDLPPVEDLFTTGFHVSNLGRIRRPDGTIAPTTSLADGTLSAICDLIMCHTTHKLGHTVPVIQQKRVRIANAVLEAFVGPKPRLYTIQYLDGNRNNPSLDNISYEQYHKTRKAAERRTSWQAMKAAKAAFHAEVRAFELRSKRKK